jgi:hypothetical protein
MSSTLNDLAIWGTPKIIQFLLESVHKSVWSDLNRQSREEERNKE